MPSLVNARHNTCIYSQTHHINLEQFSCELLSQLDQAEAMKHKLYR